MRPRWTTLLPPEHGAWAFLVLPAAVGLLRRPSWAGALLVLAVLCAFLIRVPLQRLRGPRRHPDAEDWVGLLRPLGELAALGAMIAGAAHSAIVIGIGLALVVAVSVPAVWTARRTAAWEMGAAGLFSLQAPAVLVLGGAPLREAALMWGFLTLFTLPPLFYLRQRLDAKTDQNRIRGSMAAHAIALVLVFGAFWMNLAPSAFMIWTGLLAARATWGISRPWRAGSGRRLGMLEALVSAVHLALLARWGYL